MTMTLTNAYDFERNQTCFISRTKTYLDTQLEVNTSLKNSLNLLLFYSDINYVYVL